MCRLFGFKSVISSQVHSSLVGADNALANQSFHHPDGWGVAYYLEGAPHIVKATDSAINSHIFERVSGIVTSHIVLAHLRKATLGEKTILNTHPFQYGKWVFAHNGNVKNFHSIKKEIIELVKPELRRFILGSTDSELIFYVMLTELSNKFSLMDTSLSVKQIIPCLKEAIRKLLEISGPIAKADDSGDSETYYTFILSNGNSLVGYQGGKNLYYSTYKTSCSDKNVCSSYSKECEAPTESGFVNHLIFSSEPLKGENIWLEMKTGQFIGADHKMHIVVSE